MKSGFFDDHSDIIQFLDDSGMVFRLIRDEFPPGLRPELRRALEVQHSLHGQTLRALMELRSVVVDLELCYFMVRRYPWVNTPIAKSKHLEMTYFNFCNYCYVFREKIKLFHNAYRDLRGGAHNPETWLKPILNRVERTLRKHIRFRGETVHEWGASHPNVQSYSMLEILENANPKPFDFDLDDHFRESKLLLSWEIRATSREAGKIYRNIIDVIGQDFRDSLRTFTEVCEIALSGHERANRALTVQTREGSGDC